MKEFIYYRPNFNINYGNYRYIKNNGYKIKLFCLLSHVFYFLR